MHGREPWIICSDNPYWYVMRGFSSCTDSAGVRCKNCDILHGAEAKSPHWVKGLEEGRGLSWVLEVLHRRLSPKSAVQRVPSNTFTDDSWSRCLAYHCLQFIGHSLPPKTIERLGHCSPVGVLRKPSTGALKKRLINWGLYSRTSIFYFFLAGKNATHSFSSSMSVIAPLRILT